MNATATRRAPLARLLSFLCAALAAASLATGFALSGQWAIAGIAAALGAAWVLLQLQQPARGASIGLVVTLFAAALGGFMGLPPLLLLLGVVFALSAWDLAHFTARIHAAQQVAMAQRLERTHLVRLLLVDALGLLLASLALLAQINLSFAVILGLGLLAAVGISQVVGHLRKEGD